MHPLRPERLADVVERADLHRLDRRVDGGGARDHDHLGLRPAGADLAKESHAVRARPVELGKDEVERLALQLLEGVGGRRGAGDVVALSPQQAREPVAQLGVLVEDEQPHGCPQRGPGA